jgi:hypothetical protein
MDLFDGRLHGLARAALWLSPLTAACGGSTRDAGAPAAIAIAATEGDLALPFSLDLDAAGDDGGRVAKVTLGAGRGEAVIDGVARSAAVVGRTSYFDEEVYEVLAVSPDRLDVLWIYCLQGDVRGGYVESTSSPGPVAPQEIAGTCAEHPDPATVHVTFPALSLAAAPDLPPSSHLELNGPQLSYSGGTPGSATVDGAALELYPFGVVDCSKRCGDASWYEIHALLWDRAARAASFGVFYLHEDGDRSISLAYTVTLPSLTRVSRTDDEVDFPRTTWSYSTSAP